MSSERRSQLRHRVHTPAYASILGKSGGLILDASHNGILLQSLAQLPANREITIRVDLVETRNSFSTQARVIWSDRRGRAGIEFLQFPAETRQQMKEWLFCNALAAQSLLAPFTPAGADRDDLALESQAQIANTATNGNGSRNAKTGAIVQAAVRSQLAYDDHPEGTFSLAEIVSRAKQNTKADGAAVALAHGDAMFCQATVGEIAPPLASRIDIGEGLTGVCVRSGQLLVCHDSANDDRVDQQSCQALGISSVVAVPILGSDGVAGVLEVFSHQPNAFSEPNFTELQALAQSISIALNPARAEPPQEHPSASASENEISPGDRLGASSSSSSDLQNATANGEDEGPSAPSQEPLAVAPEFESASSPRARGAVLGSLVALLIALLWFGVASRSYRSKTQATPINEDRIAENALNRDGKSSLAIPKTTGKRYQAEKVRQLQEQAEAGDADAQFELGAHYSSGEEVRQDYQQAAKWFTKAAEQGHILGAAALGAFYWAGRGVPQDYEAAYVWSTIAKAGGDEASKYRVSILSSRMSPTQVAEAEHRAQLWLQAHPKQISMHRLEPLQP